MSRRLRQAVDRWLADEARGAAAADEALRRVFLALPLPSPPVGFAARVMARAGLAPLPSSLPLVWRIGLVASMALAASALIVSPAVVAGVLRFVSAADVVGFAAGAVVETCQRFGEGLALWRTLGVVGRTVAAALSSPPLLATLLALSLMSAGGLRVLLALTVVPRRSGNVRI